jgi:hypothetical protein
MRKGVKEIFLVLFFPGFSSSCEELEEIEESCEDIIK